MAKRITIERLRAWVLVLGVVLVAVILGFFSYTRYRIRHFGRDLPGKLGVNIQQDANGYTFSRSQGGHTLFTLHASRLVQYKSGGRATLHDVSITFFGSDHSRADRVYGSDFEYDPASGIAHAKGVVHLDVQAPEGTHGTSADNRTIHAETSDMIFDQKSGQARTDAPVTFSVADAQGSATGAVYDSTPGMLILQRAVRFQATLSKGPMLLLAEHAEFNRGTRQLSLLRDDLRYAGDHNTSEQAIVTFRDNGTVGRINASGHVNMQDDAGRQLHASSMEVITDANGNTQRAMMDGGLLFSATSGPHSIHGDANNGILQLGPDGELRSVQMQNAVTVVDQEVGRTGDASGSVTREVRGSRLDINFVQQQGHAIAQDLTASGGAVLSEHTIFTKSPPQTTVMKGDVIKATLWEGRSLDRMHAEGNTYLNNTNPSGVSQTSTGDTLDIAFAREPDAGQKHRFEDIPPSMVQRAVQHGHVSIVQIKPANAQQKQPWRSQATADTATLDGPRQILHLEGSPHLSDEEAEMTAQTLDFYRLSGAVTADHNVKVTLRQENSAQAPVHAIAEKVFFDHDRNEAILYGAARPALLWQAANSIAAPQIVIDRRDQTLTTRGGRVTGVFADPGSKATGSAAVVRAEANTFRYSALEHKGSFDGDMVASQASGTLRSDSAEILMSTESGGGQGATRIPNPRGSLDTLICQGNVQVDQGGRRGTGAKLVYTSADGRFVLSGRSGSPAQVSDRLHGTVSGASLIFTNRGDSVEVEGGTARAVTDTQVSR